MGMLLLTQVIKDYQTLHSKCQTEKSKAGGQGRSKGNEKKVMLQSENGELLLLFV